MGHHREFLRWLSAPFFTPSTDFEIFADISIFETGFGRFGLVIFANKLTNLISI